MVKLDSKEFKFNSYIISIHEIFSKKSIQFEIFFESNQLFHRKIEYDKLPSLEPFHLKLSRFKCKSTHVEKLLHHRGKKEWSCLKIKKVQRNFSLSNYEKIVRLIT